MSFSFYGTHSINPSTSTHICIYDTLLHQFIMEFCFWSMYSDESNTRILACYATRSVVCHYKIRFRFVFDSNAVKLISTRSLRWNTAVHYDQFYYHWIWPATLLCANVKLVSALAILDNRIIGHFKRPVFAVQPKRNHIDLIPRNNVHKIFSETYRMIFSIVVTIQYLSILTNDLNSIC